MIGDLAIIGLTSTSNAPGTPLLAELITSLSVTNNSTVTHLLNLYVVAQGYTAPVAPPDFILDSHIHGTVLTGSADLTFATCLDPSNSLSLGVTCSSGSPTLSLGLGSFSDTQSTTIHTLPAPYSIQQHLDLLLKAGSSIDLSNTLDSTLSPVPEPSSFALLFTAVAGAVFVVRRRSQGHQHTFVSHVGGARPRL